MYPGDILSSRAKVHPGLYAVIPEAGLVHNVIPGISDCHSSILASPKLGAGFVQYLVDAAPQKGRSTVAFAGEEGIEAFIYVISGEGLLVDIAGEEQRLAAGGYGYAPMGKGISFHNLSEASIRFLLFKQRYRPLIGHEARIVFGSAEAIPYREYADMQNVLIKDLLPNELGFDLNFHILCFKPGGCHPFVETHVQEHGAYVLGGEGMYYLGDNWLPLRQGDYVWMGAFCPQAAYGIGREDFYYVYSKDCNRDVEF